MKKIMAVIFTIVLLLNLCACADVSTITMDASSSETGDAVKISYVADFYDNYGDQWLSVEGNSFNISPNKIKEYSYDSDGSWISNWTTSSVMSIDIDGNKIESCGSTVLFYDTRLEKIDIDIPQNVDLTTENGYSVTAPSDLRVSDYWSLNWWFITKNQSNTTVRSRMVIIQSQNGNPICMFNGDNVSWEVSRNLPKTTEIMIDGMPVYVHRANFAIVDLSVFN